MLLLVLATVISSLDYAMCAHSQAFSENIKFVKIASFWLVLCDVFRVEKFFFFYTLRYTNSFYVIFFLLNSSSSIFALFIKIYLNQKVKQKKWNISLNINFYPFLILLVFTLDYVPLSLLCDSFIHWTFFYTLLYVSRSVSRLKIDRSVISARLIRYKNPYIGGQ